jgi:cytochrome c
MTAAALGRVVAVAAVFGALQGCGGHAAPDAGGDAQRGADALRQYGCGACHRIPGIAGADGNVGPPLERIARRVYLAGVLANTPENMIRWIQVPQQIAPLTAMPDMHVTAGDARDIATYLYLN